MEKFYWNIKGYISYSQISTFLKSKNEFKKRYFEWEKWFSSKETSFWKMIHSQIEIWEIQIPTDFYWKEFEKEFNLVLWWVNVLAFIDSITIQGGPIFWNEVDIFEFKTWKVPWVQSKEDVKTWKENIADNHLQLWIYAMIIYKIYWVIPKVKLIYIPTENDELKNIKLVWNVKCFEVKITLEKIQETEKIILETVIWIENLYQEWLNRDKLKINQTPFLRYKELKERKDQIDAEMEIVKAEIESTTPDIWINIEWVSASFMIKKEYTFSDEIIKLEERVKELKEKEKKVLIPVEKKVLTIRVK